MTVESAALTEWCRAVRADVLFLPVAAADSSHPLVVEGCPVCASYSHSCVSACNESRCVRCGLL